MFKKSLLLCGLAGSFCFVQTRSILDEIYLQIQKEAIAEVDKIVIQAQEGFPGNSLEALENRRKVLEAHKNQCFLIKKQFQPYQNVNMSIITSSAAAAALAATYIKRSKALRIAGFATPLLGVWGVFSFKNGYYFTQAIIEELEGRIRQIDWQLKNNRP